MRRLKLFTGYALAALMPVAMVSAQGTGTGLAAGPNAGPLQSLLSNILVFTNTVLIPFIIGIGFLVFVWGMFQYFIAGGANDEAKEKGKSLMIYATLGFLLIIVFWGVIQLLANSTGLQNKNINSLVPEVKTF